jgi:hypothetical protein
MNATLTRSEVLIADLDRYTARIVEIAASDEDSRCKDVRALVISQSAIIGIWAHTQDEALKAALDRLTQSFSLIH